MAHRRKVQEQEWAASKREEEMEAHAVAVAAAEASAEAREQLERAEYSEGRAAIRATDAEEEAAECWESGCDCDVSRGGVSCGCDLCRGGVSCSDCDICRGRV